jgi:hypothetical protein
MTDIDQLVVKLCHSLAVLPTMLLPFTSVNKAGEMG